jgi:hypothetical protein
MDKVKSYYRTHRSNEKRINGVQILEGFVFAANI